MWTPELPPLEVAVRAAFIYVFLVTVFRLVPRRELARSSINDIVLLFLVTVAVRRTLVGDDSSLTSAFVGFGTLVLLDQLVNRLARRSPRWADWILGPRIALVQDGRILDEGLSRAGISAEELHGRLRAHGTEDLGKVQAAWLERDGKVTFLFREQEPTS